MTSQNLLSINLSPTLIIVGLLFTVVVIMCFLGYTEMKRRQRLKASPSIFYPSDRILDGLMLHADSFDKESKILSCRAINPSMELKRLLLKDVIYIYAEDPGNCLYTNCEIVDGKLQKVDPHRRTEPRKNPTGHRAQSA